MQEPSLTSLKEKLDSIDTEDDIILFIRDADNCIIADKSSKIIQVFKEAESKVIIAKEDSTVRKFVKLKFPTKKSCIFF